MTKRTVVPAGTEIAEGTNRLCRIVRGISTTPPDAGPAADAATNPAPDTNVMTTAAINSVRFIRTAASGRQPPPGQLRPRALLPSLLPAARRSTPGRPR